MIPSNRITFHNPKTFLMWCVYHERSLPPLLMAGAIMRLENGKPIQILLFDKEPTVRKKEPIPHGVETNS